MRIYIPCAGNKTSPAEKYGRLAYFHWDLGRLLHVIIGSHGGQWMSDPDQTWKNHA
jgi:hypothetical protein